MMDEISEEDRDKLIKEYIGSQQQVLTEVIQSVIKGVVNNRSSFDREHENVRSTVISACCGPQVNLRALSELLGIYGNRNVHKLNKYKARRAEYMNGIVSHMCGHRYAAEHYGFPPEVLQYLRDWYDDDECSTPDK